MGQYYHATCVKDSGEVEYIYSHDYEEGLKLMEHSYMNNDFVGAAMTALAPGGPWHKQHLVWSGDYGNMRAKDVVVPKGIVAQTAEALDVDEDKQNLYGEAEVKIKPLSMEKHADKIIVNHTKRSYFDLSKLPLPTSDDWTVHPLPLLTADGNGQGGGDYEGTCMELVGSWKGDIISVEDSIPNGFLGLYCEFKEGRR